MSSSSEQPGNEPPSVRWHDMVKFVRQLSHDIRNNLNAVELQSAYLAELAEETEMKNEIQRLREMVSEVGANLQRLTAGLSQVSRTPISYPATLFNMNALSRRFRPKPTSTKTVSCSSCANRKCVSNYRLKIGDANRCET